MCRPGSNIFHVPQEHIVIIQVRMALVHEVSQRIERNVYILSVESISKPDTYVMSVHKQHRVPAVEALYGI